MNKRWFIHTAQVETFQGESAYGDVFADPVSRDGYLEDSVKLVRNATGQEVVSSAQWYTDLAHAAEYTADSRFTTPRGRMALVIGVNIYETPLGIEDHIEVYLT